MFVDNSYLISLCVPQGNLKTFAGGKDQQNAPQFDELLLSLSELHHQLEQQQSQVVYNAQSVIAASLLHQPVPQSLRAFPVSIAARCFRHLSAALALSSCLYTPMRYSCPTLPVVDMCYNARRFSAKEQAAVLFQLLPTPAAAARSFAGAERSAGTIYRHKGY